MEIIEVNEIDFTMKNGSYKDEYLGNIVKVRSTGDCLYFTKTGDRYCYLHEELIETIQKFLQMFSNDKQDKVETRKQSGLPEIEQIEKIEELQAREYKFSVLNVSALKAIQKERLMLALKKNNDYSGVIDNIEVLGIKGIAVRLFDKASRLCSLVLSNTEQKVKDESIRDTLLDTANYADYGVMLLDGTWGKERR